MAGKRNGTLYIGVTNDLAKRVAQHRAGVFEGITQRYGVHGLVYFECYGSIELAIKREKQLKKWNREWKLNLIEKWNPDWIDLSLHGFQYPGRDGPGFPPSRE